MIQSSKLEKPLSSILGQEIKVISVKPIGGGSISNTMAVNTNIGHYFLKSNDALSSPEMFEAEMDGLLALEKNAAFKIPRPYGISQVNNITYFLMDLIIPAVKSDDYSTSLAHNLAALHRVSDESYGYHRDNFIGSLIQSNKLNADWGHFFIKERMDPQIKLARDQGLVDSSFVERFEIAVARIINEMPIERPALLHGDLWSGNLMVDDNGNATIIDPAVYFGHREMDIAFTHMFGGFSNEFYQTYNEIFPMEPGFEDRLDLYNLYPYLVHLNLFGRSYFSQIDQTIARFT